MKKILLSFISILVLSVGVFAQEDVVTNDAGSKTAIVNKKGEAILPVAGDIAIGMDMVPFMNYLGNFSNNTVDNSYNSNGFLKGSQTLMLKYFLQDEMALRVIVKGEKYNYTDNRYVADDAAIYADPLNADAKTTDQRFTKGSAYTLGIGVSTIKRNYEYSYGNSFSEINQNPTFFDFNTNSETSGTRRIIKEDGIKGIGYGAELFLGVEYFFMPNICLGSELTWGTSFDRSSQITHEDEYWNGSSVQNQKVLDGPGNTSLNLGMTNPSISLYLMFHF